MLKRIIWILHLASGLLLIFSAHVRLIDPVKFVPAAFLSLGFMIFAFLNTVFLIYWLFTWNRKVFFGLLFFVLSFPTLGRYVQISLFPEPEVSKEGTLKVMTYNVRVFDLYNWSEQQDSRGKMMNLIGSESPDVLCLQEFYYSDKKRFFNTTDSLKKIMGRIYDHIHYTTSRDDQKWGIATFSKYPIAGTGTVDLPEGINNSCLYTDIVKDGDTIRVYNVHLASIGMGTSDYQLLGDLNDQQDEKELERTRNLVNRFARAFRRRATHAQSVKEHMDASPYKVILCGDFNDTPASYTYQKLSAGLNDSFLEKGNGFGVTYTHFFPSFRIDYIIVPKEFRVSRFKTIRKNYSDHYPVVAELLIP